MNQRVSELIEDFDGCCDAFDRANLFTGPSAYFHSKTLTLLRQHRSASDAVLNNSFIESLYATLTAWGMHRMGPGNAKLVNFPLLVESLKELHQPIKQASSFTLLGLNPGELEHVSERVWVLISDLKIGQGLTKIVAGSKALHHVLPELIPPIDREYTIRFFFHNKNLSQGGQTAFREIYPHFYRIAMECSKKIEPRIGLGMNTSTTKVIDNAIVGYVLTRFKTEAPPSDMSLEGLAAPRAGHGSC